MQQSRFSTHSMNDSVSKFPPEHSNLTENTYNVQFPLVGEQTFKKKNTNYIRTTKYTLLTFIPYNFYFQFKRLYNVYFLIAAITVIPGIGESSLSPATQIFPICFVVALSAIKDAIEDYNRYKQDNLANNTKTVVIREGKRFEILAKDIQPGDITYFVKDEKFTVDCILLSSNYEDGSAYVDTAELDGETNLKRRTAPQDLVEYTTLEKINSLSGEIQSEQPNQNLLAYEGRLKLPEKVLSININNLLLRGAVLKNTEFAWGLVLYTGPNTKIMKNLKKAATKTSRLEKSLNKFVFAAFLFNMAMLISSVLLELDVYRFLRQKESTTTTPYYWYLGSRQDTNEASHVKTSILSFFALFAYVIPISLFVSIEVVRLCQGLFMFWDHKMARIDGKVKQRMRPNNTSLNEELGQVEYIFSDKTGTLTCNDMVLVTWFVNGTLFDERQLPGALSHSLATTTLPNAPLDELTREYMLLFLRAIALANSAIPATVDNQLVYESQSPDETAILNAARKNLFTLTQRTKTSTILETKLVPNSYSPGLLGAGVGKEVIYTENTQVETYQQLVSLEFSSDRKRMSSIVRTLDGAIHLYCKGADNIIFGRLDSNPEYNPPDLLKKADDSLEMLSEQGLRTLVVAWKPLTEDEYAAFKAEYDEAEIAINGREAKIAAACEKVEINLRFLGCTAIEDRLQDEVPETIEYLLKCDIRVWLLTGDKQETAINIGMSSRLISPEMKVYILRGKTVEEINSTLEKYLGEIGDSHVKRALVVNGDALAIVFSAPEATQQKFLKVGLSCHSVICCRVTPLQKALVVKLVQGNLNCVTLAIGDGANDVSMIQMANIGVGIMGKEGAQAVRASDYAFAEFRFLRRLIAVHGRYSYLRLVGLIMFSFYKNIAMIMVMWWFGFQNLFSGQIVYEEIFMTAYNIIFTSVPPVILAIFDRDVNDDKIEQYPQLYRQVKGHAYWNVWTILGWLASALWHCIVFFGTVWFVNADGNISFTGRTTGYFVQTTLYGTPVLLTVLLKFALTNKTWVWLTLASVILSLALNLFFQFVLEYFGYSEVGNGVISYIQFVYYLLILLIPVMCLLPDFTLMYFKRQFMPHDADIIMEEQSIDTTKHSAISPVYNTDIEMRQVEDGGLRHRNV